MRDALTLPNLVSVVRLLLVPLFIWLVAVDEIGWAGILLGFIGATDWIDGYLARRLGQVSEVGKFLDPLADRLAVFVAVIAGLVAGILPAWFAWALIVRELLIGAGALYGWFRGITKLDVRWLGKAATLGLYFAITGFYLAEGFDLPWMWWLSLLGGTVALVLYWIVAFQYLGDLRAAIATRD